MENIFTETLQAVEQGASFKVNFKERTLKVNGKKVELDNVDTFGIDSCQSKELVISTIEDYYSVYKHSRPTETWVNKSHHRMYFKALREDEIIKSSGEEMDLDDMLFGESRDVAQCRLELYVLLSIINGTLKWYDDWGGWYFWQSSNDKQLVLFREWIEPQN